MSDTAAQILAQGWYPHLHRFNLLPSRALHPSWHTRFSPQGAIAALDTAFDDEAALHRHWSAHILTVLGLAERPFLRDDAPQLPLAILPVAEFDRLILLTGAVLAGGAVRHMIRRDDVAALQLGVDPELLSFARSRGREFHPGLDLPADTAAGLADRFVELGAGAMVRAMQEVPDELFERVRLRLPIDTPVAGAEPLNALHPATALELMLRLTSEVDPEWLSFCGMTH